MRYANVSNLLEVTRGRRSKTVAIEVHTSLFGLMKRLGVPVDSSVTLYLDYCGAGWMFGLFVDDEHLYDLWRYPSSKIPSWLGVDSL